MTWDGRLIAPHPNPHTLCYLLLDVLLLTDRVSQAVEHPSTAVSPATTPTFNHPLPLFPAPPLLRAPQGAITAPSASPHPHPHQGCAALNCEDHGGGIPSGGGIPDGGGIPGGGVSISSVKNIYFDPIPFDPIPSSFSPSFSPSLSRGLSPCPSPRQSPRQSPLMRARSPISVRAPRPSPATSPLHSPRGELQEGLHSGDGTPRYSDSRIPSYCDRILWRFELCCGAVEG